jgi:hypothetical protein
MNTFRIILLTLLTTGSLKYSFAQDTTLNRFNTSGQKHGKWLVYLDNNWKEVSDSSQAVYRRFTIYDNGFNIFPMGPSGKKGWKLRPETAGNSGLLNGEYSWVKPNGEVNSTHSFTDGQYNDCKEYDSNGNMIQHFDFSKRYKDELNTYFLYQYDKNANLKRFYIMRNGREGWALYEFSEDDLKNPEER